MPTQFFSVGVEIVKWHLFFEQQLKPFIEIIGSLCGKHTFRRIHQVMKRKSDALAPDVRLCLASFAFLVVRVQNFKGTVPETLRVHRTTGVSLSSHN